MTGKDKDLTHIHDQITNLRKRMDERFDRVDDRLQSVEEKTIKNYKHNEAQNGRIDKLEDENKEKTVDWLKRQGRKWSPHITIIVFLIIEYFKGGL